MGRGHGLDLVTSVARGGDERGAGDLPRRRRESLAGGRHIGRRESLNEPPCRKSDSAQGGLSGVCLTRQGLGKALCVCVACGHCGVRACVGCGVSP